MRIKNARPEEVTAAILKKNPKAKFRAKETEDGVEIVWNQDEQVEVSNAEVAQAKREVEQREKAIKDAREVIREAGGVIPAIANLLMRVEALENG